MLKVLRLLPVLIIAACAGVRETPNTAISTADETSGYRWLVHQNDEAYGNNIVLLAFSGGGTRAAAFSYGVMQELRDTLIPSDGGSVRLLDEVDTISSVSGGSFTAAYYGVFREEIFSSFEQDFLRLGVQQALVKEMLNPQHWVKSATSGFNRTEMAVNYYEERIFKGATFADIEAAGSPYIEINATDLTTGMRFPFNQERFDLICSNLAGFSVARAVTASSAVPVVFPTVALENHANRCDLEATQEWAALEDVEQRAQSEAQKEMVQTLKSYRNADQRKYIHLVDGGVSDNLGLSSMVDRLESIGAQGFAALKRNPPANILIISVNAEVQRSQQIEQSPNEPSVATTMSAYTSAQMLRSNRETVDRLQADMAGLQRNLAEAGLDTRVYFSEVSFDQVQVPEINRFLNSLPTSLELDDEQVDKLIGAGRLLLRSDQDYLQFKQRSNAHLVEGAMTDAQICGRFGYDSCVVPALPE